MKKSLLVSILFLISELIFASESLERVQGFVLAQDLNGDGIQDLIASGPIGQFGNGGGPFLLRVSVKDGRYKEKVLGLSPYLLALEKSNPPKLWTYWKSGAQYANMSSFTLDGVFEQVIFNLDYSKANDVKLFEQHFKKDNYFLKMHQVIKYTPPPHPTIGWGK